MTFLYSEFPKSPLGILMTTWRSTWCTGGVYDGEGAPEGLGHRGLVEKVGVLEDQVGELWAATREQASDKPLIWRL